MGDEITNYVLYVDIATDLETYNKERARHDSGLFRSF